MTELAAARTLVVEGEMPHSPDFQPIVGHKFNLRATPMPHWNGVTDCRVLIVEPQQRLSYSWNVSGEEPASGLKTVVTWTLTPTLPPTHFS